MPWLSEKSDRISPQRMAELMERTADEARRRICPRPKRYAPGHMCHRMIERVGFRYANLNTTLAKYPPERLREGMNELPDGEQIFFIPSPSTGLWATRDRLAR